MTTTRKHDTQIAPRILKRNRGRFHVLTADKGYDDSELRAMLRGMKVGPLIRHREFKLHDRAANARMDKSLYHRRSLLESINSAVKREYGNYVRSSTWERQFREIVAKHLIYNIDRAIDRALKFLTIPPIIYLVIIFKPVRGRISTRLLFFHF